MAYRRIEGQKSHTWFRVRTGRWLSPATAERDAIVATKIGAVLWEAVFVLKPDDFYGKGRGLNKAANDLLEKLTA
jgi:hypothetical protein